MAELKIKRLNRDSSWWIQWGKSRIILDPWLLGPEIDGFSWINEQEHAFPCVKIEELPPYDIILVTQSYSDHCHKETLAKMEPVPLYSTSKAFRKLKKWFPDRQHFVIPDQNSIESVEVNDLKIKSLHPGTKRDPVYFGLIIYRRKECIIYLAHGFDENHFPFSLIDGYHVKLFITSFTEFDLPSIMGGKVNPGLKQGKSLADSLEPEYVLNTHDEAKKMKGLVGRLGKVRYPEFDELQKEFRGKFLVTEDYEMREIE
jgi:hypothetical protein